MPLTITDLPLSSLRRIAGITDADEPLLGAVYALLRPETQELAGKLVDHAMAVQGTGQAIMNQMSNVLKLRQAVEHALDRMLASVIDAGYVLEIEELSAALGSVQLATADVIAASSVIKHWARGKLLARLGEWRRAEPMQSALERLLDLNQMLILRAMTQMAIEAALDNLTSVPESGTFMESLLKPRLPQLHAAPPAGLAPVPEPEPATPDEFEALSAKLPNAEIVQADFSGRCVRTWRSESPDEDSRCAQGLTRRAMELGRQLRYKTFDHAIISDGERMTVIVSGKHGLVLVRCANREEAELVLDAVTR